MKVKGYFSDVLRREGKRIWHSGWRPNTILVDYGRFLAALMKKAFNSVVGIEYIVVGSGSDSHADFMGKTTAYFDWLNQGHAGPYTEGGGWIWAKKITSPDIKFLDTDGLEVDEVTHLLRIAVTLEEIEPTAATYDFREFGLVGIDLDPEGHFDTNRLFFINHVSHGQITKDQRMELSRTIKLTFPSAEEEMEP